jgi:cytochrome c oxidase accessory protein FixG
MTKRHLPLVDAPSSLRADGSRAFVYTADVHGRFARARTTVFAALIVIYVALPWIQINGRPAVFLDVERREFALFGATFNAQDAWLVFFLITGLGFTLALLTAVAGRVWCGWACPQTVFLDGVFRRIERFVEGPRDHRVRRDAGEMNFDKAWRKTAVHTLYVLVALFLAHVLVSYFVSLPRLYEMVRSAPGDHPGAFATSFVITAILYVNFAHFREQLCLGVCPYGRLQGALTDAKSLVVGYDETRGEPRGKASDKERGACVDCKRCVVVCPTGIDIRNGQQLDCIGCTACIDACDEVMDKLHQPRGLIRYDSIEGLEGKPRKFFRPRLVAYAVLGVLGLSVASLAFRSRSDFEANLLRLRGTPYTLENEVVRNAFDVHVVNKRNERATLLIEPVPPENVTVVAPIREVTLDPFGSVNVPLFISIPRSGYRGEFSVPVRVRVVGGDEAKTLSAPFLGPSTEAAGPGAP